MKTAGVVPGGRARLLQQRRELLDVDRLGQVPVEPRVGRALDVLGQRVAGRFSW
jgi:hypothetical protein